jgi:hypothetical protein
MAFSNFVSFGVLRGPKFCGFVETPFRGIEMAICLDGMPFRPGEISF